MKNIRTAKERQAAKGPRFVRSPALFLEGTYLELRPQYGCSGYWVVVDGRMPDVLLGGPLLLKHAKSSARAYLAANPDKRIEVAW